MKPLLSVLIGGAVLALSACSQVPSSKPMLPYPFQALGTEPGWSVVLNANLEANVILDTGAIQFPAVFSLSEVVDNTVILSSTYQNQPLTLSIAPGTCNDTMSDTVYDYQTVLEVQGQSFQGCGRPAL